VNDSVNLHLPPQGSMSGQPYETGNVLQPQLEEVSVEEKEEPKDKMKVEIK
jgi:hypothetical protein